MTTLNATFESKLALEDEGYESGSENCNTSTHLRRTSKIHHFSSDENISFDPVTPCITHTSQLHFKPVQHQLTFSSSYNYDDTSTVDNSSPSSTLLVQNPVNFLQQPHPKCILSHILRGIQTDTKCHFWAANFYLFSNILVDNFS